MKLKPPQPAQGYFFINDVAGPLEECAFNRDRQLGAWPDGGIAEQVQPDEIPVYTGRGAPS